MFCKLMQESAAHFAEKIFGNCRWNTLLTENVGEFPFYGVSGTDGGPLKNLFKIRISPTGAVLGKKSYYRPDHHRVEWLLEGGKLIATLVFPPDRYGAVLYVEKEGEVDIGTQVSLFTWDPSDASAPLYADYCNESASASFKRDDLSVGMSIRTDGVVKNCSFAKVWQSIRVNMPEARDYVLSFSFAQTEEAMLQELEALQQRSMEWRAHTEEWWDSYFASCPLATAAEEACATTPSGRTYSVSKEAFELRQLWLYYWTLASIIDVDWCRATPLQVADRRTFNQSFSNDNTFGIELLSLTSKSDLARRHLLNLIQYLVGADGHVHWSIDLTGNCSTFTDPHGVPAIAHALGFYVRASGDVAILDEDIGGISVWAKLQLIEEKLLEFRDVNNDGLCEWNHIWETGEDNKDSPFFKKKGLLDWLHFYETNKEGTVTELPFYQDNICPVTCLNEQAFHLWSLGEMIYLARLRGESDSAYIAKREKILSVLSSRHWNEQTGFYYDYDVCEERLWDAKNLDAYYCMYFEKDDSRVSRMVETLFDPCEFGVELFPSLSVKEDGFDPDSYWSGPAWPREQGFVVLALANQGFGEKALQIMRHVLMSEPGLEFSETVNPLSDPVESHSPIAMTMCSINQVVLLGLCGGVAWSGYDNPIPAVEGGHCSNKSRINCKTL